MWKKAVCTLCAASRCVICFIDVDHFLHDNLLRSTVGDGWSSLIVSHLQELSIALLGLLFPLIFLHWYLLLFSRRMFGGAWDANDR